MGEVFLRGKVELSRRICSPAVISPGTCSLWLRSINIETCRQGESTETPLSPEQVPVVGEDANTPSDMLDGALSSATTFQY